MAFKLSSIKNLFRKLTPYAAKGVANYGDDVARAVVPYTDDAAKAAANYGDDVLPFVGTRDVRGKYKTDWGFDLDEGDVVGIGKRTFHRPSDDLLTGAHNNYRGYLEYLDDIEMDYGVRPLKMSFEELTGQSTLNQMTKDRLLDDYLSGARSYDSPESWWKPIREERIKYGMPPPQVQPTFQSETDYKNLLDYLDNRDAVKRVNEALLSNPSNVSTEDAIRYAGNLPNMSYYDDYDENDLQGLYDILTRRKDAAKNLESMFGKAPKSLYPLNDFGANYRLYELETALKKFKK